MSRTSFPSRAGDEADSDSTRSIRRSMEFLLQLDSYRLDAAKPRPGEEHVGIAAIAIARLLSPIAPRGLISRKPSVAAIGDAGGAAQSVSRPLRATTPLRTARWVRAPSNGSARPIAYDVRIRRYWRAGFPPCRSSQAQAHAGGGSSRPRAPPRCRCAGVLISTLNHPRTTNDAKTSSRHQPRPRHHNLEGVALRQDQGSARDLGKKRGPRKADARAHGTQPSNRNVPRRFPLVTRRRAAHLTTTRAPLLTRR